MAGGDRPGRRPGGRDLKAETQRIPGPEDTMTGIEGCPGTRNSMCEALYVGKGSGHLRNERRVRSLGPQG